MWLILLGLPIIVLFVNIVSTWNGSGSVEHIYTSLSFDVSIAFTQTGGFCSLFDIFGLKNYLNQFNASLGFTNTYLSTFFYSYFGYLCTLNFGKVIYDLLWFLPKWICSKLGVDN